MPFTGGKLPEASREFHKISIEISGILEKARSLHISSYGYDLPGSRFIINL